MHLTYHAAAPILEEVLQNQVMPVGPGQADQTNMKKPILFCRVRRNPFLNEFIMAESITH